MSLFWRDTRPNFCVYKFTLPFEPYRRTCTRFYGRGRALKTSQFFFKPTPHHDGPPFDPMPASEADPQASAAAFRPTGRALAPFSALWRFVTNGVTSKTHSNGHSFDLPPTSDDLLLVLVSVVAAYHKDATTRLFLAQSLRERGHRHCFYGGVNFLWLGVQLGG